MNLESKKISDNEIEITQPVETPEVVKTIYERGFIENQIVEITRQRDEFNALRDAEIANCNSILAEMDKLKIVAKEETTIEEVIE